MKKYFICLGLGVNQLNLLKKINKEINIIAIDKDIKRNIRISKYYKTSIYNLESIKQICIELKEKNFNILGVVYRSSGPTIISAEFIEKFFSIKRIDKELMKCIYSKSYFSKYLKKNNIKNLFSKTIKKYPNKNKNICILKPDAPILGKANVYMIDNKNIYHDKFNLCKYESHNNKVNISKYYNGNDISSFYLVFNKEIKLIANTQEFNYFLKNKISSIGICSPPFNISKKYLLKKNKDDKKIIKLFEHFYGIMSISSKITKTNKILPYEINIGLSGDKFADEIYPCIYENSSLYDFEINMALLKKKKKFSFSSKKFAGILNGKFFKNKDKFKQNLKLFL